MPYDRRAKGWAFGDVVPVFKSQEHGEGGANDWWGAGGPIHIRRPKDPDAGTDFLIAGDARARQSISFSKSYLTWASGSNSRS